MRFLDVNFENKNPPQSRFNAYYMKSLPMPYMYVYIILFSLLNDVRNYI